jgi:hypothetical protein
VYEVQRKVLLLRRLPDGTLHNLDLDTGTSVGGAWATDGHYAGVVRLKVGVTKRIDRTANGHRRICKPAAVVWAAPST